MKDISLKELLEAGCHFGHQASRWQPKASGYIYGEKGGVHIIDLVKTKAGLEAAGKFLGDLAQNGGSIIFVGVKRQAKTAILDAVKRAGVYYIIDRWPGGMLTNFSVIHKNLVRIDELKTKSTDEGFTKKERLLASRDMNKLLAQYGGLVGLDKLPDAVFLVDIKKMAGAVMEAKRCGVKIVAICDSNVDPEPVDYPIPANDDAVGSVKIIVDYLAECWIEGKK